MLNVFTLQGAGTAIGELPPYFMARAGNHCFPTPPTQWTHPPSSPHLTHPGDTSTSITPPHHPGDTSTFITPPHHPGDIHLHHPFGIEAYHIPPPCPHQL